MSDATPLPESAPDFWGERVMRYDAFIRRIVPHYDDIAAVLLDYTPPAARVLELGCGTGNLSLRLVRRDPAAAYTFVDAAPEMLEVARERIRAEAPATAARARFVAARFEELELDDASHDLVISALALHHVEPIAGVYSAIGRALVPGGALRIADGVRGTTESLHRLHFERWERFWRERDEVDEDEIREVLEHAERHDHYIPLVEHFRLLGRAGLVGCDCVWRDGLFAILTADRPFRRG
ncbi:MAG: class I SAM-dependent methyltransferase [Longimicrobiales bacterium]